MRSKIGIIPWLMATMVCWGCFKAPVMQQSPKLHTLETAAVTLDEGLPRLEATLAIVPFKAATILRTTRMVRLSDSGVKLSSRHLWAVPPADMLTDLLTSSLANSGIFKAVWQQGQVTPADFSLTGFIEKFQSISNSGNREAVLAVIVVVTGNSKMPAGKVVMFQKHYQFRTRIQDDSPQAMVSALSDSARLFTGQLAKDLVATLGKGKT